jgi:hypothetical protein
VVNTGGLLQHPISLSFDCLGNLYIRDAGPGGLYASNSKPGYVVRIPVGGAAFKMTIPSVTVVYPQALATDPLVPYSCTARRAKRASRYWVCLASSSRLS